MLQEKLAGDLFGVENADNFTAISLNDEKDYVNFAKIVHSKIATAKSRSYQVAFIGELLRSLESNFKAEDYQNLQQKINVLINTKLKAEKGKEKKKTKGFLNRTGAFKGNK